MSKYTPGPWNLSSKGDGRTYVEASSETADDIAVLLMDHDQRQNSANARLIAAAPDLLKACKRAVHLFDYDDATSVLEWVDSPEFRAAIAKAEGR